MPLTVMLPSFHVPLHRVCAESMSMSLESVSHVGPNGEEIGTLPACLDREWSIHLSADASFSEVMPLSFARSLLGTVG